MAKTTFQEQPRMIADCQDTREEYQAGTALGHRMGLKFSETAHESRPFLNIILFSLDVSIGDYKNCKGSKNN